MTYPAIYYKYETKPLPMVVTDIRFYDIDDPQDAKITTDYMYLAERYFNLELFVIKGYNQGFVVCKKGSINEGFLLERVSFDP